MRSVMVALVALFLVPRTAASTDVPQFLLKWGMQGSSQGDFDPPAGVTVDDSNYVYVADGRNHRIQKFAPDGRFINSFFQFFLAAWDVAVAKDGSIYVADANANFIYKYSAALDPVTQWGGTGTAPGKFKVPQGVAVDSVGDVFVADTENYRIQKFHSDGMFVSQWGTFGTGDGQFTLPTDIALDRNGNVYIADGQRIQKLTANGDFLVKWGSFGSGDGQFRHAIQLAVDSRGNVYVVDGGSGSSPADCGNARVQEFTSTGVFVTKWGSCGNADGQFDRPIGIAVDVLGDVFVSDETLFRIQKFRFLPSSVVPSAWTTMKARYRSR